MGKGIEGGYEYYAFISYKREDEKWAKWLQKRLESYNLPAALRDKNPRLPNKIRPVFRDQSELSGGNLKAEIEKGLNGSRYLIVICSPRSAKSPWVSREVQHFINQGREEYIIPFIIGGTPNASSREDECFPEGLRQLKDEKEILGININEMGRDAAAIKVIARMFDLRFDTLWQRHEKEKKARRLMIGTGALMLLIASWAILGFIANQNLRLEQANEVIKTERDRANMESDRAIKANLALSKANDSIQKSAVLLHKANSELDITNRKLQTTNSSLEKSNKDLAEEKKRVEKINQDLMMTQSRSVASEAHRLLDEGETLLAAKTILEVVPGDADRTWPYSPEVEFAVRRCIDSIWNPGWHSLACLEHDLNVNNMAFGADGKNLVTASDDNTAVIYDVDTGLPLNTLMHGQRVNCVAYSPDGNLIATGCRDKIVRIFDAESGKCLYETEKGGNPWFITFDKDGSHALSATSNGLISLNLENGTAPSCGFRMGYISKESITDDGNDFALHFGNNLYAIDYQYLFSSFIPKLSEAIKENDNVDEDLFLKILDDAARMHVSLEDGPEGRRDIKYSSISPEGDFISAVAYDSITYLFDCNDGKLCREMPRNINAIFNHDGTRWVTIGTDSIISIIDTRTGDILTTLPHDGQPTSARFSPYDDFLVSTASDGIARIWETETWTLTNALPHPFPIFDCEISPSGNNIAVLERGNRVRLWGRGKLHDNPLSLALINSYTTDAVFDNENVWLSSLDRTVRNINLITYIQNFETPAFKDKVIDVDLSHSKELLALTVSDDLITLIDPLTGVELPGSYINDGLVYSTSFSPDDRHLLVSSADTPVKILSVPTLQETGYSFPHPTRTRQALWLGNDSIITLTADSLYVWDVASGRQLCRHKTNDAICIAVDPSGHHIAVGTQNNTVTIYDYPDLSKSAVEIRHGLEKSFDMNLLDADALWKIEQQDEEWMKSSISGSVLADGFYSLFSRKTPVRAVAFSADGTKLITVSDRSARVWDAATGALVNDSFRHPFGLSGGSISDDGSRIMTVFNDNERSFMMIWKNQPYETLINLLKMKFQR